MRTLFQWIGIFTISLMMVVSPAGAADVPKILTVLAIKVKGDQDAYLQRVKQLIAIQQRLETGATMRVWRATAAGRQTGMIYVGIEYPSLEAFATATTKVQADEEWKKVLKDLDTSGLREVISSSMLVEVTP